MTVYGPIACTLAAAEAPERMVPIPGARLHTILRRKIPFLIHRADPTSRWR